jgi:hypothetical protein
MFCAVRHRRARALRALAQPAGRPYTVQALEPRHLLCALHDHGLAGAGGGGADATLGTWPAAAAAAPESTEPAVSTYDALAAVHPLSSRPALHSRSGAFAKVFLDFDGDFVANWGTVPGSAPLQPYHPGTIPAYDSDGDAATFSDEELDAITRIWQNVAEKFSPFDVDVTTVDPGNLNNGQTFKMDIGGTNAWLGSGGGVAYVDAFTNARENIGFVFSTQDPTSVRFVGDGAAHEIGHAFGLQHQGITTNGVVTTEYSGGSGETAPIMGAANTTPSRRGIWFNGESNNRDASNNLAALGPQDDLAVMSDGHNGWGYRPDDFSPASVNPAPFGGNGQGKLTAAGIINSQFDADGFKFTAGGPAASFDIANIPDGGMLGPQAELVTYPGNVVVPTSLYTGPNGNFINLSTANLTAGQQYALNVHGNFSYGSIGQYTVKGTVQTVAYVQDGVVHVNGFDNVADFIKIDLRFILNKLYLYIEDDINGDPNQSTVVTIPYSDFNSLIVSTGSGYDHVTYLQPLGARPSTVDMGSGFFDIDNLEIDGSNTNADAFTMNGSSTTVAGMTVSYTAVTAVTLRGNGGDDTFTVSGIGPNVAMYGGEGNDTATYPSAFLANAGFQSLTFIGENGSDTAVYGDGLNTGPITFNATSNPFASGAITTSIGGASRTVSYTADTVRLVGGPDADTFNVDVVQAGVILRAEGYNGDDVVNVGSAAHPFSQDVRGEVDALGGANNDLVDVDDSTYTGVGNYAIQFGRVSNSSVANLVTLDVPVETLEFHGRAGGTTTYTAPSFTSPGVVREFRFFAAAGGGISSLTIDDRPVLTDLFELDVYPDHMQRKFGTPASFIASMIAYSGFEALGILASNVTHVINDYGTSPEIAAGQQTSIIMGTGNDTLTAIPHDAADNLSFPTPLGIGGGSGTDRLVVDDTASASAIQYLFNNPFGAGTADIFGLGASGIGAGSDVETISVLGGGGNDTFTVSSFKSGNALAISGGEGDDVLDIGAENLAANVTSIASFLFNGQGGTDRFNLNNTVDNTAWTYTRDAATIVATRSSYGVTLGDANVEAMTVRAGPGGDLVRVRTLAAGTSFSAETNGGSDSMVVSDAAQNLSAIHGPVAYDAGSDGGNVYVYDNADATGRTAHLTGTTLGATAGDDLFGLGGSLSFANLTTVGSFPGMTLNLGSGADTVFAQPLAGAKVTISAANPTTAPGDQLRLALAGAQGYVISGTAAAGSVAAANWQTLNWTGFETGPSVDDSGPFVDIIDISPDPRQAPVDSIDLAFSEAVVGFDVADLSLTRDGGGNLLNGSQTLSTTDGINWTLGGLTSLTGISGAYTLTLTAAGSGVTDAFGNALTGDAAAPWTVSLPSWLAPGSVAVWNPDLRTLNVTGPATVIADPGVMPLVSADGGAAIVTIDPSADTVIHLGSLSLTGGAAAAFAAHGAGVIRALVLASGAPEIDLASTFDLADNVMVIQGGTLDAVQSQIAAGFNHGVWNGTGGINSSSAAADASYVTTLAVAANAQLGRTEFAGVTGLTASDLLVKYTYDGDSDLSGRTTLDDFTLFLHGYQTSGTSWFAGDYDFNGLVTLDDFALFLKGYQQQAAPL